MENNILISSIENYITQIKFIFSNWKNKNSPWFRGQPKDEKLLPSIYRNKYNENTLVQIFRLKSQSMGNVPNIKYIDQWLFLMQHSGLPTRLLDWTEGALIALFFSIYNYNRKDFNPVVWMLNTIELNKLSVDLNKILLPFNDIGLENFRGAFENDKKGYDLPVAVYPSYVHIRMSVQKSCFTIHGKNKKSFEELFNNTDLIKEKYLIKLKIDKNKSKEMLFDLNLLGISYSTLFPEFYGLSKELKENENLHK